MLSDAKYDLLKALFLEDQRFNIGDDAAYAVRAGLLKLSAITTVPGTASITTEGCRLLSEECKRHKFAQLT